MSDKLQLYVWMEVENFLQQFGGGSAIAIAHSVEEARHLIHENYVKNDRNPQSYEQFTASEPGLLTAPVVYDLKPLAFYWWGSA